MGTRKSTLENALVLRKGISMITLAALAPIGTWLTSSMQLETLPIALFFALVGGFSAYGTWIDDKLARIRKEPPNGE